jgi:hypothetical protein
MDGWMVSYREKRSKTYKKDKKYKKGNGKLRIISVSCSSGFVYSKANSPREVLLLCSMAHLSTRINKKSFLAADFLHCACICECGYT